MQRARWRGVLGCRDSGSIAGSEGFVGTENMHVGVERQAANPDLSLSRQTHRLFIQ